MDMVFFPYNSMYTIDFTKQHTAVTYSLKLNGERLNISHQPYWKKDFLETAMYGYCRYIKDGHVFLENYIRQKFNGNLQFYLLRNLIPDKNKILYWPKWYVAFAGYDAAAGSSIELVEYHFKFDTHGASLIDSFSIYKTTLAR